MKYILAMLFALVSFSSGDDIEYRFSSGSGAFVNPEYLITAYHVVNNYRRYYCYLDWRDESCYALTLVDYDTAADIALLKLVKKLPWTPAVCCIYEEEVPLNTRIVSYGYHDPFENGYMLTSSGGEIKMHHGYTSGYEFYAVAAHVAAGTSGGPVADTNGYIVGYNHSRYSDDENIGNITKSTEALKLIRRNGVKEAPNTADAGSCAVIVINSERRFDYKRGDSRELCRL